MSHPQKPSDESFPELFYVQPSLQSQKVVSEPTGRLDVQTSLNQGMVLYRQSQPDETVKKKKTILFFNTQEIYNFPELSAFIFYFLLKLTRSGFEVYYEDFYELIKLRPDEPEWENFDRRIPHSTEKKSKKESKNGLAREHDISPEDILVLDVEDCKKSGKFTKKKRKTILYKIEFL